MNKEIQSGSIKESLIAPIVLGSFSYFWLFKALLDTRGEMAPSDIYPVIGLTSIILAAQFITLILAKSLTRLLFPIFALANTYLLYIVLSAEIGLMNLWVQIGICAAIMALYWVALDIILRAGRMRNWLVLGAPVLATLFIGISSWPLLAGNRSNDASPANIRTLELKHKPNIYFLSFDSMIPVSLSNKFLGISTPPYIPVLKKHQAQFLPNNFTDAVSTKRSLASILNMGPTVLEDSGTIDVISGQTQSGLRHILTANGYKTHFTFESGFTGPAKGKYLTSYNIHRPFSACRFLTDNARRYGFFGYCTLRDKIGFFDSLSTSQEERSFLDYAYGLIETIARDKNSGPHFYMQHVLYPSHTLALFAGSEKDYAEYRKYFERRSVIAADAMDRMLTEIRTSDPSAVIFLYGDHGTFTSRKTRVSDNKQFFIQDRYGTLGAVINAENCEPYLSPPEGERFQTNARIVAGLVQCLAGGESPFIEKVDFGAIRQIPNERFEDYVYE